VPGDLRCQVVPVIQYTRVATRMLRHSKIAILMEIYVDVPDRAD
jgi:hypothetical protein